MENYKLIVTNNIDSILLHYIIQGNDLLLQKSNPIIETEEFDVKLKQEDAVLDINTDIGTNANKVIVMPKVYEPDDHLGILGEKYIERLLIRQSYFNKKILNVDLISESQPNYTPGYDIEIDLSDKTKLGVEVKSTRKSLGNVIHITNNELRSALINNNNYYLIIVVFDNKTEDVSQVFRLKNPIKVLALKESDVKALLEPKNIGRAQFYSQQFILTIDKNLIKNLQINDLDDGLINVLDI